MTAAAAPAARSRATTYATNGPERCGLSFVPAAQEAEDFRQIREALEAGQSIEAISRHLGRSFTYVKYRARKMGLV